MLIVPACKNLMANIVRMRSITVIQIHANMVHVKQCLMATIVRATLAILENTVTYPSILVRADRFPTRILVEWGHAKPLVMDTMEP